MKNNISRLFLLAGDILGVFISICLGYGLFILIEDSFNIEVRESLQEYTMNIIVYVVVIFVLFGEKIYKNRYDFWEETRLILRGIGTSVLIVLSILALSEKMGNYSRLVIVFSFIFMAFVLPTLKNILKKFLFNIGLWKRSAEVYGNNQYVKDEVFRNHYLGYVYSNKENAQTVFIDTEGILSDELQKLLDINLKEKKEVFFIPLLKYYNFSNARILELSNAQKNLIVFENALLKKSNIFVKKVFDLILSILISPLLFLSFTVIILFIKREEPKGSIFFKQKRIGYNGEEFVCYKFRSMYENGDQILKEYLKDNPDEVTHYEKYHKYKNDPRITKIGRIMRETSLDELPQIVNVFKGEMSFIGPRPYIPYEKKKIGNNIDKDMVLAVKPGITGLWQVSGRSDVDFNSRVYMDVWYTRNWNLWLDLVILVKTIKVVIFRSGAY